MALFQLLQGEADSVYIFGIGPLLVGIGSDRDEIVFHRADLCQHSVDHHFEIRTPRSKYIDQHNTVYRPDRMVGDGCKRAFRQVVQHFGIVQPVLNINQRIIQQSRCKSSPPQVAVVSMYPVYLFDVKPFDQCISEKCTETTFKERGNLL